MRTAILVTGSRDWADTIAVRSALLPYRPKVPRAGDVVLIHGDARGLDKIAGTVADVWSWSVVPMPAPWTEHGTAAGGLRNQWMVNVLTFLQRCDYECHVFAFPLPSSKGTWDCIRKAQSAGFTAKIYNAGDGT